MGEFLSFSVLIKGLCGLFGEGVGEKKFGGGGGGGEG